LPLALRVSAFRAPAGMQGHEGGDGPSGGGGGAGRAKGKAAAEELGGSKKKAGIFLRELRLMMYGFGDDPEPLPETVELVEEMVIEYITDLVHRAQEVAARRGRLTTEDVLFLIRKAPHPLCQSHACSLARPPSLSPPLLIVSAAPAPHHESTWLLCCVLCAVCMQDPRKFARARELLAMNVELKEARKAFQEEQ
ncbi:unnamed protein product, partial [Closterium sp. NIES-54]